MESINPATGVRIASYPEHEPAAIDALLDRAVAAYRDWRLRSFADRGRLMAAVAAVLRAHVSEFSELMTLEMGKPIAAAESEVEKCAVTCEHFARYAERYLAAEDIASDAAHSFVRYDPLGVVLAVMPWNFPFWQAIRCAAPALMAGNVVVLKHASNVPGSALALERVFAEAGLPAGAFTSLLIPGSQVDPLIRDPRIAGVSVTGSEATGASVASVAGAALKKCVLELGGSDPFIVLADADVDAVAVEAAAARTINNGESCIAAKRFIVAEPVADAFLDRFTDAMRRLVVGDPLDRATQIGPLARPDLVDALERQVGDSVRMGAQLTAGGKRLERPGSYFPPTVLANVEPGMPVFDEETFGPVAAVIRSRDERHAIALANLSRYGLGASIWTADAARGERLAADIEAGCVFVNGAVKSDARLPFGGVKASGWGRELSAAGIREFTNVKTVWRADARHATQPRRAE